MATKTPYPFTTKEEIERMLTAQGLLLQMDDSRNQILDQAELDALDEIIDWATEQVELQLGEYYDSEKLKDSPIVRRWATIYACYFLSRRRGRPGVFRELVQEAEEWMALIVSGARELPRVPRRDTAAPVMTNYVIDERYRTRKIRTQDATSTGSSYPGQDSDFSIYDPLG